MMTEDEVKGPLLTSLHTLQSRQVQSPCAIKFSCLSQYLRYCHLTHHCQLMAGVRDQDSCLGPFSMGNTQSWGEADTKSVHFLDVVAANWHWKSRQFIPFPNCHMLINPGHSDLISCHRQVLVLAASAHNQQSK